MSEPSSPNGTQPPHEEAATDEDRLVEEIVDGFLSQLQAGRPPDKQALISAHPQIAEVLNRRLTLVEKIFRAAHTSKLSGVASSSEAVVVSDAAEIAHAGASGVGPQSSTAQTGLERVGPGRASPAPDSVSTMTASFRRAPIERARHLECPHCGNDIQVVEPAVDEITCHNCGSTFQVDSLATTTFRTAEMPSKVGKFEILELLGRGGFGSVYKAEDSELDRIVAIKMPRSGYFVTAEEQERFLREARHAARLKHPSIVQVHEIGHERGVPYIVSDYIEGMTLADLLTVGVMDFRDTADLMARIADALEFAHREKVIHRDVKPSNILIDKARQPHVTDFGLARRDEGEITVTLDGQILGTPAYMSPEQASGSHQKVDGRSDVYSLGVILYRMISGELPFQGNKRMLIHQVLNDEPRPPRSLNARIPRDLETICLKAMAKEVSRRYSGARAMADDLRRWLAGEPIHARPTTSAERLWRWCRRNPAAAGLTAAVAVLLIVASLGASAAAVREHRLRGIAVEARTNEAAERTRAEQNAEESRKRLIKLNIDRGVQHMEAQDLLGSLVWFAEALKLDHDDAQQADMHRVRIGSILRQCPKLNQSFFHDGPVRYVEFNSDASRLVTASEDHTARVWDAHTGLPLGPPLKHARPVVHATFSPDDRLVATTTDDEMVQLWEVGTGDRVIVPIRNGKWLGPMAFSPDSSRVITASDANTARVWNVQSGEPITPPLSHEHHVTHVSFSPDGSRVLTATGFDGPGTARVWDAVSGDPVGAAMEHSDWIWSASFSSDGRLVVTASRDNTARVWDAQTGDPVTPALRHSAAVLAAAFSRNGRRVVTASRDGTARVWDATTGQCTLDSLEHNDTVTSATFSFDDRRIVTSSYDGSARVWSAGTGEPLTPPLRHGGWVWRAWFSPDSRQVLTASSDWTARIWDTAAGHEVNPQFKHTDYIVRAYFSPDARHVLTVSADNTVGLWDAEAGTQVASFKHEDTVHDAVFSPDGRSVVTVSSDNTARVWSIATGEQTVRPLRHLKAVRGAAFSPDSSRVATASLDKTAGVWDASTGKLLATLAHDGAVYRVAFSPDGRRVLTASEDKTARVWDTDSSAVVATLQHGDSVIFASFSPDGRRVVTASKDRRAIVWDAATGASLGAVMEHNAVVWKAFFSPDGKRVVTASSDGTSRIWDAATGSPVTPPLRHSGQKVLHASFSADGGRVITASDRTQTEINGRAVGYGAARLWDAQSGEPITPPLRHRNTVSHASLSPDGRRALTASYDRTAQLWDLLPDLRPADDLVLLAQLLSSHEIDSVGGYVPVSPAAFRSRWQELRAKYPSAFKCTALEVSAWQRENEALADKEGDKP